jgi:hypothetical protein
MKLHCVIPSFACRELKVYTCTFCINNVREEKKENTVFKKRNAEFRIHPWGVYKMCSKILNNQFGEINKKEPNLRGIYINSIVDSRIFTLIMNKQQTPWPEFSSELYRPSDCRLSAKLVPTFVDRGVSRSQRDGSPRPYSRFSRPQPLLFLSSSSSIVFTRLSELRSRPTTSQKIW